MRKKRDPLRQDPKTEFELSVRNLPISELRLDSRNPNRHERRQIVKIGRSIKKFGFLVPVLIDGERNVIAGHGRILAGESVGMSHVPTIEVTHLDRAQRKTFMIADNQLCRIGVWDDRLLGEIFKELSELELDFSLELTGFSTAEIDLLIDGLSDPTANEDDEADRLTPIAGPSVSKLGDNWALGPHRLSCADARAAASYHTLMDGQEAAAVFTDPPYNLKIDGNVSGLGRVRHREFPMASGELSEADYTRFLHDVLGLLAGHCKDGAVLYVCIDWRHLPEILAAVRAIGCRLLNICVWVKHNAGMGSFYRSQHELVLVLKTGPAPHRNNIELGRHGRNRSNVWQYRGANDFGRGTEEGGSVTFHPTPKPVAMVADAIMDCTERGDIVLDAFLGSGTALIAAERTGRRCFGMELDPLYVDAAIRRWQAYTGGRARHAVTGRFFDDVATEAEGGHDR